VASFEAPSRYLPTRVEERYEKFPGGLRTEIWNRVLPNKNKECQPLDSEGCSQILKYTSVNRTSLYETRYGGSVYIRSITRNLSTRRPSCCLRSSVWISAWRSCENDPGFTCFVVWCPACMQQVGLLYCGRLTRTSLTFEVVMYEEVRPLVFITSNIYYSS
jgi:hypothetical protein